MVERRERGREIHSVYADARMLERKEERRREEEEERETRATYTLLLRSSCSQPGTCVRACVRVNETTRAPAWSDASTIEATTTGATILQLFNVIKYLPLANKHELVMTERCILLVQLALE